MIKCFDGYCPTQDKWENVEQTYLMENTSTSESPKLILGLMHCPYVALGNDCAKSDNCPIVKKI